MIKQYTSIKNDQFWISYVNLAIWYVILKIQLIERLGINIKIFPKYVDFSLKPRNSLKMPKNKVLLNILGLGCKNFLQEFLKVRVLHSLQQHPLLIPTLFYFCIFIVFVFYIFDTLEVSPCFIKKQLVLGIFVYLLVFVSRYYIYKIYFSPFPVFKISEMK